MYVSTWIVRQPSFAISVAADAAVPESIFDVAFLLVFAAVIFVVVEFAFAVVQALFLVVPAFAVDEQSVAAFVDVEQPAAAFVAAARFVAASAFAPNDVAEPFVAASIAVVVAAAAAAEQVVVVVAAADAFGPLDHGRHVPHFVPRALVDQSLRQLALQPDRSLQSETELRTISLSLMLVLLLSIRLLWAFDRMIDEPL